ncbi:Topoisomerase 1-associated factor 1 [Spiromyces aspiralis]|uniref:Topoisomerase 1-associated factor 1 n=1 Tax=Spiromyces aspiralis TaxID=68401 RepID=A0ACC1HT85_9FUNG|nr:Topoisomerase 1-associated factor 1 [Spiromyces aspiralis]
MLIKGVLYVFRNVLMIEDVHMGTAELQWADKPVQDKLIRVLDETQALELFLTLASSVGERGIKPYAEIVLELFYYLYHGVPVKALFRGGSSSATGTSSIAGLLGHASPGQLAAAAAATGCDKQNGGTSLDEDVRKMLEQELHQKQSKLGSASGMATGMGRRHNRFGSTYVISVEAGKSLPIFNPKEAMKLFATKVNEKPAMTRHNVVRPRLSKDILDPDNLLPPVKPQMEHRWRPITDREVIPVLRRTARTFIRACFGEIFPLLLEDLKIGRNPAATDRVKYWFMSMVGYFLECFWNFAQAEHARLDGEEDLKPIEFGHVARMVDLVAVPYCLSEMHRAVDLKEWGELMASLQCFEWMLKVLDLMAGDAGGEGDEARNAARAASEHVQSNLYYDGDVLDLVSKICRVYKPTSHSYEFLVQLIDTIDVFLGVLTTFARRKKVMIVRRKVKRRKAKPNGEGKAVGAASAVDRGENDGASATPLELGGEDSSDAETDDDDSDGAGGGNYVNAQFDMIRYQKAFAIDSIVKTYMTFLTTFASLKAVHLEAVHRMLFQICVTCQRFSLLFKQSYLEIIYSVLSGEDKARHQHLSDDRWVRAWDELVDLLAWVLRRYFSVRKMFSDEEVGSAKVGRSVVGKLADPVKEKRLKQYLGMCMKGTDGAKYAAPPELHSKMPGGKAGTSHGDISATSSEDEDTGRGECDEVVLPEHLTWSQKLGVEVGRLIQQGKGEIVGWLQEEIRQCLRARPAEAKSSGDPAASASDDDELEAALGRQDFVIVPDEDTIGADLAGNPSLRTLLDLLKFEWQLSPVAGGGQWVIPGLLESEDLESYLPILDRLVADPLDEKGRRIKSKPTGRRKRSRRRDPKDLSDKGEEEERISVKKKRKAVQKQRFLSAQFVHSSDDEDLDFNSKEARNFFAREAEMRKLARRRAVEAGLAVSDDEGETESEGGVLSSEEQDGGKGRTLPKRRFIDIEPDEEQVRHGISTKRARPTAIDVSEGESSEDAGAPRAQKDESQEVVLPSQAEEDDDDITARASHHPASILFPRPRPATIVDDDESDT